MSALAALIRAQWLTMASYRVRMLVSIVGLLVTVVPLYFVADAVQPVMANAIRGQGDQAFGFLLVGLAAFTIVQAAVMAIPNQLGSGISTGTLEALLATPVPVGRLILGIASFPLIWTGIRAAILLTTGWVLGADLVLGKALVGAVVLLLIGLAHIPFGLMAGALVVAFRTAGPLPNGVLAVSGLLGGVYYPTHVVPSWLATVSDFLPLTYGLNVLRRTILEGQGLGASAVDLAALVVSGGVLLGLGSGAFALALGYARRQGTLAQY